MNLVEYNGRRYERNVGLKILTGLNILFAAMVLFGWRAVGAFLSDPMSAATLSSMNRLTRPEPLDYPYILLWGLPAAGIGLAWASNRLGLKVLARVAIIIPLLFIALVCVWYEFYIRALV